MYKDSSYSEKLKDPRWQKKRLRIFQRDHWTCQVDYDTESTLEIHHKTYLKDANPWDYPDDILITLCGSCHEAVGILINEHTIPELEMMIGQARRGEFEGLNDKEVGHYHRIYSLYCLARQFLRSRPA